MPTMSLNHRRRMMARKKILIETIEKLTIKLKRRPTVSLLAHEYDMPVEWMQRFCEHLGVMNRVAES